MGSAGLVYDAHGQVAWDQIWGSFCHLAMAGGPPHKGLLLEPGPASQRAIPRESYDAAATEVCRGISLVTGLRASPSDDVGWVDVACQGDAMAGWLLRAITMENVAVRRRGALLQLPVAARFRIEKEVKNVITVVAKTCHYWLEHTPRDQQRAIGELLFTLDRDTPLIVPDYGDSSADDLGDTLAARVAQATGLPRAATGATGWLALECGTVEAAVWMMRGMVVGNVLARREGSSACVPIPRSHAAVVALANTIDAVHRLAVERGRMRTVPPSGA